MTRVMGVLACLLIGAAAVHAATLVVSNPLDSARPNAICIGPASLLGEGVAPGAYEAASRDGQRVPVQVDDLDGDGAADELAMVLHLPAAGETVVWVDTSLPWRGGDFAEARTSWRYDNYAVLDTDRMGFGLYGTYAPLHFIGGLQWDIYAKRPQAWRLCLDALESIDYHNDNPVAVDILLVANSMALGGPIIGETRPIAGQNASHACRELCDGPVRAGLEVRATDWRTQEGESYDATIRYLVYAHHDFIDATFDVEPTPGAGEFGLGVRRLPHPTEFIGDAAAGILGSIGQQPGIIGRTGLGLVFDPACFSRWEVRPGEDDAYVVRLSEPEGHYRAWLVGVWDQGGVAGRYTFISHMRCLAARFGAPPIVSG
ncbi:MAG: DUF4861 family protein [Armatimonadota bacterium]